MTTFYTFPVPLELIAYLGSDASTSTIDIDDEDMLGDDASIQNNRLSRFIILQAVDFSVILSSFMPKGGQIESGSLSFRIVLQRLQEEVVHGPAALFVDEKKDSDNDEEDDNDLKIRHGKIECILEKKALDLVMKMTIKKQLNLLAGSVICDGSEEYDDDGQDAEIEPLSPPSSPPEEEEEDGGGCGDGESRLQVRPSHILTKHQGSRRKAQWKDPEGRVVMNTTKESAISQPKSFHEDILAGKCSFDEIASLFSDCNSAKRGRRRQFGPGQMQKPSEEAAFALKVDEISDTTVECISSLERVE
ncbi:hypothetical protein Cgig2_019575 [Carnegiea gigantea]|uniref:peptidylprolyl isomerase n=1 Tax=Carnegiea gigantea TaxID=171969 RepID=A0A9Q1QIA6_9CARY|nr:hypothetical protein Cgig2_019575 [Carnegiea gigantea]